MRKYNDSRHTLALIGNGFDMAHGYKTDYHSFVDQINDPNLDYFRSLCEKEHSITTWYSLEDSIRILSVVHAFLQKIRAFYGQRLSDQSRYMNSGTSFLPGGTI